MEVERIEREAMAAPARRGRPATFADACERYLARPEGVAPATRFMVEYWELALGGTPLDRIDRAAVDEAERMLFHDPSTGECRLRPSSLGRYRKQLKAVLNDACERGMMAAPPKIRVPKESNRPVTPLEDDELEVLLAAAKAESGRTPELEGLLLVGAYTGARPIETARLTWADVRDVDGPEPFVVLSNRKGKGGAVRTREVALHGRAADWLRA